MPWLQDRKWCYIRMEGTTYGDVPLNAELKLEVWDSPNSAGVITDAIRCLKLGLDRGLKGTLVAPSAYFMKSPPRQIPDDVARERVEAFIRGEDSETLIGTEKPAARKLRKLAGRRQGELATLGVMTAIALRRSTADQPGARLRAKPAHDRPEELRPARVHDRRRPSPTGASTRSASIDRRPGGTEATLGVPTSRIVERAAASTSGDRLLLISAAGPAAAVIGRVSQLSYLAWPTKRRWSNRNFGHVLGLPPDHPRVCAAAMAAYMGYGRYLVELMRPPSLPPDKVAGLATDTDVEGVRQLWSAPAAG